MRGNRELVNSIAPSLDLQFNLNWTEYPVYVNKERKIIFKGKVMLYATAYQKKPKLTKPVEPSLQDFL